MPTDTPTPTSRSRPGRLLAVAAGILAFGVLVGFLLTQTLRPRMGENDVVTGGVVAESGRLELNPAVPAGSPTAATRAAPQTPDAPHPAVAPSPDDAALKRLAKKAESAPADVEAQLALVRAAVDANRGDLALPALDRVLKRHPKHPAALTYLGLMTAAQGRHDHGLELIDQALASAPNDTFALWAKGGLLFSQRRDYKGAAAAWEAMLRSPKLDAGTRATVQEWVAEARWRQEHGDDLERPRQPGTARQRAAAPSVQAGPIVSGTVTLGPGVTGGPAQSGALFVIARRGSGPPVAVKRIESPRFPVAYSLGPEDAMMRDRPIEGDLEIVARLSRSGAAGPARAGDLEGRFAGNPVRAGAGHVDIVLDPVAGSAAAQTPRGASR